MCHLRKETGFFLDIVCGAGRWSVTPIMSQYLVLILITAILPVHKHFIVNDQKLAHARHLERGSRPYPFH